METVWKDTRFALRMLAKSPGFTLLALAALMLGIGANTAIFSIVNASLMRPLPFRDPDRLMMVWEHSPHTGKNNVANPQNVLDWQARSRSFEQMGAFIETEMNLTGNGEPEQVHGAYVTRGFFPILAVQPSLGRNFVPEEDTAEAGWAVILSRGLWRRRYGGDPNVVGKKLLVQGNSAIVVGVMPESFEFPEMRAELWTLMTLRHGERRGRYLEVIGRLKPGVSEASARAEMDTIGRQLAAENTFDAKWGVNVVGMRENFSGSIRTPLLVLLGAVGMVLLIACANVANLMLMRSSGRRREIAIRASLGATRARILRQFLVESALLGITGGSLGLLLAVWAKDGLLAMLPEGMSLAHVTHVSIDGNVLAFTLAVSLGSSLLFGLIPGLRACRPDLSDTLKEGGRGSSGDLRRNRLRAALAAGEMAIAMMLLIGAGLLIKSLVRLRNVSPGFQAENVLSLRLGLSGKKFANNQQAVRELDEILDKVRQVPGVSAAGSIQWAPLSGLLSATSFRVDGRPAPRPGEEPVTGVSVITPGYFSALRIPLVKGRVFDARDRAEAPLATVVNQAMVRQYFPNRDPIGQRLFVSWGRQTPYEIVGVVADVRHQGLNVDVMPGVYFANAQEPETNATLMLRTEREPLAVARGVQDAIHARDPDLAIADVQPLERSVSKSVASPRFQSFLLGSFAALALLLAAIGIYGVMAYSVAQRTHELGLRMALGAERSQVMGMVVRQALVLAMIGAVAGLAGALALTRFLKTLLFDVSTTDFTTFAVVPVVLCVVALAASWIPATRATRVDPMVALRYE